MNILIKVKKVGNHWYPNVEHDSPEDIVLNEKIEKVLSFLDEDNVGEIEFLLYEVHSWLDDTTIQFDDEDMWKWLNTTDVFDLKFYIKDNEYKISSLLLDILEDRFNLEFYKTVYSLTIYR